MTQKTSLPNINTESVKYKVIEGLESKVKELGELRVPIVFSTDYPASTSNAINDSGDIRPTRRIVVKRNLTRVKNYAIGDVAAYSRQFTPESSYTWDTGNPTGTFYEIIGEGWFETTNIELSIWCREADDRDNLIELVKMWMLELTHRNLDNGAPYFYNNKIYEVQFTRAYESPDTKVIADQIYYVGVIEYVLSYPVYGTTVEEYEKLKVSVIGRLEGQDPDRPVIIIDPNKPIVKPPGGAGGGGSDNGMPPDTYFAPELHYGTLVEQDRFKEILYVGGPLRTDGGMLIEQILKDKEEED